MTALIVILSVLLFLLLLLICSLSFKFSYINGELQGQVRYLFFRFDLLDTRLLEPVGRKPKRKKIEKKRKIKPEEAQEPTLDERKMKDMFRTGWALVKVSRPAVRIIRRHLVIRKLILYICVGGNDAHEIALKYAKIKMAVAALFDVIGCMFILKTPKTGIACDFTKPQTVSEITFELRIRLFFVMTAAVHILYRFFGTLSEKKKNRQNIKGGKQHERAASHK